MMVDPFAGDGYTLAEMTKAINLMTTQYGRLGRMGLFNAGGGVRQRTVLVEMKNNVINLLPTVPVGGPPTLDKKAKRNVRPLYIPHIPHDGELLPDEIQGIRAFGSENVMETQASVVAEKLRRLRDKHDLTLEFHRMGALKGVVIDADGGTIVDFYNEFGVGPQTTVDFELDLAATDVAAKSRSVIRTIESRLKGETMTGVHALVSPEFFDALVVHEKVQDVYRNWSGMAQFAGPFIVGRSEVPWQALRSFTFGGITFEEYPGTAFDGDGNERKFIAANEGYAFPLGTRNTFATYYAPGDFIDTANTIGLPYYARIAQKDHNRGWDIHTQSNPLAVNHRPEVVIKITI